MRRFFCPRTWAQALSDANGLKSGDAGLTDGSKAGDRCLPDLRELQSLVDYGVAGPTLPVGPCTGVVSSLNWSSTTDVGMPTVALGVSFDTGAVVDNSKGYTNYVWWVQGGP